MISRQIDENGAEVTHAVRKVKDEYMPEYSKEVEVINNKLNELLMEKNTYTFEGADINGMVENLPDDGGALDFEDINMLDAILGDNGEA